MHFTPGLQALARLDPGLPASSVEGGQQNAHQQGYDGDDHEQLYECESLSAPHLVLLPQGTDARCLRAQLPDCRYRRTAKGLLRKVQEELSGGASEA